MKTLKFSFMIILVLLASANVSAARISKHIYKNFAVGKVQKLDLNNKYGNIFIENGRTDSVIVSAEIWVEGNSDRAQRLLNSINVEVNLDGSTVVAVTNIGSTLNWNNEFSIDYHIEIPADRELAVIQKYGNVNMKDLTGKGVFEIKYGELTGQKLLSSDLSMDIAYSKVNIEALKDLALVLRYSKFRLDKGANLKGETRYSGINIADCNQLIADSKYDSYSIQNINTLILNSMYTGTTVDRLMTKLELVNGYGGFTVKQIPAGFESVTIENKYAGIRLGIAPDVSYQLNGSARYSTIKHPEGKVNKLRENSDYQVNGIIGNQEHPKSAVRIATSYGNVSLVP